MNAVITLTEENFDDYFQKSDLLIIDFWTPWCEPCKDYSRLFAELANELPQICFGAINVDEEKRLAKDFSVQSVPTTAIIRQQIMILHQSGIMPKNALRKLLDDAMKLPEL